MWKILQITALFGLAVVIGFLLHPLASIVFLLLAKIISVVWADFYAGYRATYHARRKSYLRTDDGDSLEIVAADDMDALAYEQVLKENHL